MTPPRTVISAAASVAAALVVAGCAAPAGGGAGGGGAGEDGGLDVVTSAYPLQWVSERVAGDAARVSSALPPGTDVHEAELAPTQALALSDADVVVTLPGLQAGVDAALDASPPERVVDVTDAAAVVDDDLHFWGDPLRLADVGDDVAEGLAAADPNGASGYRARAGELRADLQALDERYATALAPCRGAVLVTSHEAFGYLADRYGLEQVGVAGLDPSVEPTPARLRAATAAVQDAGVRTVYFETEATDAVTRALASALGTGTAVLDPMETAPADGADLLETAEANLAALEAGLSC